MRKCKLLKIMFSSYPKILTFSFAFKVGYSRHSAVFILKLDVPLGQRVAYSNVNCNYINTLRRIADNF